MLSPAAFLFSVLPLATIADDLPLTRFPLFTQAASLIGNCASSISARSSTSLGCHKQTPAVCLCNDPSKSLQIAHSILDCVSILPPKDSTTATQLRASYCLTNAGVSARDETRIQDIPLYTQVISGVQSCATSLTSMAINSFGCEQWTKASCLCADSSTFTRLSSLIQACVSSGGLSVEEQNTAGGLWSSFCEANLKQPATRIIGAPISILGTFAGRLYQVLSNMLTF